MNSNSRMYHPRHGNHVRLAPIFAYALRGIVEQPLSLYDVASESVVN